MRSWMLAMIFAVAAHAGKPLPASVAVEDEYVALEASAYVDKEGVTKALGRDPGVDLIVVEVKLVPRGDHKVQVNFDDFTLISRKDGQRSQPLAPSQIAGSGALVVNSGNYGQSRGGMANPNRGPIWGGVPGTDSRPRRIGGDGDSGALSSGTPTQATVTGPGNTSDNPVLDALKEKALPQKETNESVTGLLYFLLEGKHKMKQLELMYKSPAGRLMLDFEK